MAEAGKIFEQNQKTRFNVFAHSVVGTETEDPVLFEHWVTHYLSLGIGRENFLLVFHAKSEDSESIATFRRILSSLGVNAKITFMYGEFNVFRKYLYSVQCRQQFAGKNDWILLADVDEFQEYPEPLVDFLRAADQRGCYAVRSRFNDRFANDYLPKKVVREVALESQFPKSLRFTQLILRGCCTKIAAHKMQVMTSEGGNHSVWPDPRKEAEDPRIIQSRDVKVHHYKWTEGIEKRLAERDAFLSKSQVSWKDEAKRALAYLETNQGFRPSARYFRAALFDYGRSLATTLGFRKESHYGENPASRGGICAPASNLIKEKAHGKLRAFVYGSGDTTRMLKGLCESVVSIHHDPLRHDELFGEMQRNPTVTLRHVSLDENGRYCRAIAEFEDLFDIVVVTGRDRVHCIEQAVQKLSPRGVIVLNESNFPRYADAVQSLRDKHFSEQTLRAQGLKTSFFYKEGNCLGL